MLHAKEEIAACEGVPPCQQRLLWRGLPLEPDHAPLYKFGIRSGDTLVVGYRFPRPTVDVPTPVAVEDAAAGEESNDVLAMIAKGGGEDATDQCESMCVVSLNLKDGLDRQEYVPESGKAVREHEGTDFIQPADAKPTRGGLDIDGDDGSDGSGGSDGSNGLGDSGGSGCSGGSSVPADTAVQGHGKGSGRRAWWSKKTRNSRNVHRHERDGVSGGGVGGAAVAASSAGATHTHSAPPAPLQPARDASGGTGGGVDGIPRDTESTSAAPAYPIDPNRRGRQPPTPLVVRAHFSGWVRRKHGRRVPAPSASSPDGGNGGGNGD